MSYGITIGNAIISSTQTGREHRSKVPVLRHDECQDAPANLTERWLVPDPRWDYKENRRWVVSVLGVESDDFCVEGDSAGDSNYREIETLKWHDFLKEVGGGMEEMFHKPPHCLMWLRGRSAARILPEHHRRISDVLGEFRAKHPLARPAWFPEAELPRMDRDFTCACANLGRLVWLEHWFGFALKQPRPALEASG